MKDKLTIPPGPPLVAAGEPSMCMAGGGWGIDASLKINGQHTCNRTALSRRVACHAGWRNRYAGTPNRNSRIIIDVGSRTYLGTGEDVEVPLAWLAANDAILEKG